MQVTLLRHGETAGNLLGQYIGSTDAPLCPQGLRRATSAPPRPDVAKVLTSSLLRARQTAGILYPQAEIFTFKGLDEMNFGQFEGKSWRDLEQDAAYRAWVEAKCEGPCPGGEDKAGFIRRCVETVREILAGQAAARAPEVHFVVHGGTIMAVMSQLAQPPRDYFSWKPDFCGGYRLAYRPAPKEGRPLSLLETLQTPLGEEEAKND